MSEEKKYKEKYEKLKKEFGERGNFIEEIAPLMEKLKGNDEIVKAILNDKITSVDGKVSIKVNW
ncbi:MAG: hypothetical protein KKB31_03305 [Nanoarchaeota archaeon]|nr:hypothetical protein [Nanoarchaeota archaeon]